MAAAFKSLAKRMSEMISAEIVDPELAGEVSVRVKDVETDESRMRLSFEVEIVIVADKVR